MFHQLCEGKKKSVKAKANLFRTHFYVLKVDLFCWYKVELGTYCDHWHFITRKRICSVFPNTGESHYCPTSALCLITDLVMWKGINVIMPFSHVLFYPQACWILFYLSKIFHRLGAAIDVYIIPFCSVVASFAIAKLGNICYSGE